MKFYLDNYQQITASKMIEDSRLICDNQEFIIKNLQITEAMIKFGKKHYLKIANQMYPVEFRYIVKDEKFINDFKSEKQLGAIYAPNFTLFRLWAPTAYSVKVILIDRNEKYPMHRDENGVYECEIPDLSHGTKYLFEVEHETKIKVIDPYAKASGINQGYSVVVDFTKFNSVSKPPTFALKDLLVYELHVRDFTNHPAFSHQNQLLGLMEQNLKNKYGDAIGFDYLNTLNVSHIQLLPIYDFGSVQDDNLESYNWGYDPVQYNVIKPLYGSNKNDDFSAINDLKQVVNHYHDHNIGVIMDVVYNHVYEVDKFSLHQIVPHYFVRLGANNQISNGTFCGNEFETNTPMGRKFIVDSLVYLTKTYQFSGYRFDLMGIMDIKTLKMIARELKKINPDILLYGEGWHLPTVLDESIQGTMGNYFALPEYGFFNDNIRDFIRGKVDDEKDVGVMVGKNIDKINEYLHGKGFLRPVQSINYASCHDNHTLLDRLLLTNNSDVINRLKLAYTLIILSRGIPFIHAGCEFGRTKNLLDNTYNLSAELNAINWDLVTYNQELIDFVVMLIKLRQSDSYFNINNYEGLRTITCELKITDNQCPQQEIMKIVEQLGG